VRGGVIERLDNESICGGIEYEGQAAHVTVIGNVWAGLRLELTVMDVRHTGWTYPRHGVL
jgi:hypothetical protein